MENRSSSSISNIVPILFAVIAVGCVSWAGTRLSPSRIDTPLIVLVAMSIAVGAFLKANIERYDLHSVIGFAFVLTVVYLYGGDVGVIAAAVHFAAVAVISSNFSKAGNLAERAATASMGVVAATAAWQAVATMFGPVEVVAQRSDMTSFIWIVAVATIVMYTTASILNFVVFKFGGDADPRRGFDKYLVDSLIIFGMVGVAGGLAISGIMQTNAYVVSAVAAFFALVFYMYRRYVSDISTTADRARSRERIRAESAESKVETLEKYVGELETMTQYLQESHEKFRHAAYHDELTGLPNRNYFIDRLKLMLQEGKLCRTFARPQPI